MKQQLQIKNSMQMLFWSLAFLLLLVPVKGFGQVTLPHYDPLNYTVGQSLTTQTGWALMNTSTTDMLIASGNLSYNGLPTSTGNKVAFGGAGEDVTKTFTQQTSGTVYCSFLLNVSSLGSLNSTGGYLAGFTEGLTTTFGATVWTRLSGTGYNIGINPKTTAANTVWDSNVTPVGSTILVVISYQIVSGTLNDVVKLWVNPTLGSTEPTATLSATNGLASDLANLNRFFLRQDSASATPNVEMDEFRIGTTWASVTPAATPVITGSATTSAFTTTYGTPSAAQSFTISGANLTASLVATAPTNFEVSSDNSTFGATATYTQSSGSAGGTVYIRLKASAPVSGNYNSQNIVLSSTGATSVNITTPSSGNAVSPATLTITAVNQSVAYGSSVASVLAAGSYTSSGFVNSENASVISGSVSYTTTYTDTTAAGTPGVTISPVVSSLTAANYTFSSADGTIAITFAPVPVITSALSFSASYGTVASTYTITATNAPTSYSASGLPSGLTLNGLTGDITGTPTAVPGAYSVSISASNSGGTGSSQTLVYTITAKPLTVNGAVADNKIYDRTSAATISGSTLVGVVSGDVVTISNTGTFASSLVANGIVVTSTQTLGGADKDKYSLTLPTGLTANITAKALTINGATAQSKQFDGTTAATLTGTLNGVISPDVVTLTLNGVFASSSVGNNIAVTSTSTIGGANAGNYTLTQPTGLTANITPAIVPLLQWNTFGNTGNESTQTTSSFGTNMTASNLNYTGSTVTPNGNGNRFGGTWASQTSVATNQYIQFTATPALGYMFTPTSFVFIWDRSSTGPSSVALRSSADGFTNDLGVLTGLSTGGTSTTTFRTITISGLTALSSATTFRLYAYNGTGGTAGFDCASSQNNVILNGYTEAAPPPSISVVNNLSALTTVYGTASSSTSFNVSGTYMQGGILVTPPAGYEVSLSSGSGYAATVTVGAVGTISSTPVYVRLKANATAISSPYTGDIVLSSPSATSVNVATVSSTVTPKTLTVSGLTASNKVYDGNTDTTLTGIGSLVGVINGDVVSLDGTPVGAFVSSAIGSGITVNVTGYSISGAGSGNYTLTQPTLSADITSMPTPVINSALTASATYGVASATYTITASETPTSFNATGLPAGLSVDTNTGDITGTPTAIPGVYSVTISATNAGGTGTATLNYTILAKTLTITGATADNKVYNKSTAATISGSTLVGVVSGDVVTVSNTGTFASSDVANGIAVTSTQTLGGANANKYSLTLPTGLSANITPKALTINGATALNKEADGNTNAVITGTLVVIESGDVVTLNGTGTFASAAIGNGIAVTSTATLGGANAGNYTLTQPTGLTANITPQTLLQWNTFGNAGTETTEPSVSNNTYIAAANLTLGSGITAAANPNRFGGSGWFDTGNTATGSTLSEAIAGNNYIQFVVTPNSGYTFTPTSFSFLWDFSGTGPKSVALRSSADGYATDLGALTNLSASTSTFRTISISSLVKVSVPTTFRLYGFGGTNTGGTAGFDLATSQNNVILYGTTALLTGPTASVISGTNSICAGDPAAISVTMTGGKSPFTVVYTDGTNNYTETNYVSGTSIIVTPTINTTYTLVSVTDANALTGTGNSGSAVFTILPNITYYLDSDGDGYGNPANVAVSCATSLSGYVTNNTDCDDSNASIYRSALLYTDLDGDGYSVSSAVTCYGASLPAGTSLTSLGSDCNDNNASMHATYTFYTDADSDGFGAVAASAQVLCAANATTPPSSNLSPYNTDCDDTRANVYPGATDVCYDGLDNDCNGNIDNVGMPGGCTPIVGSMQAATCGATISALNVTIGATNISGATGYRFKVTRVDKTTNLPIAAPVILDRPVNNLALSNVAGTCYDSRYMIEVAVKYAGVWQPYYGPACFVNTPNPVSTIGAQCGTTLTAMNQSITTTSVTSVTAYTFRVTQMDATGTTAVGAPQTTTQGLNKFNMTQLSGILFGTWYKVEVSLRNVDGVFLPYNAGCNIKTPAYPTTQVRDAQCNNYQAISNTESINADAVSTANMYRFRLTSSSQPYDFTYDTTFNKFSLNKFPGLIPGETYTVEVSIRVNGQTDFGPYGKACTIITPPAARSISNNTVLEVVNVFEAMAIPNPFAENFKLDVKTNSEELIQVKVYDMLGKLVESRSVTAVDVQTLEVGANYPSGVYNVIVSQGEATKTLRVIKR